jgi:hypothetical protein
MTDASIVASTTAYVNSLKQQNPNILFIIKRSKNDNVIVYEWIPDQQIVQCYWLDIDPAYQKAARSRGIKSDRVELNFIERNQAYGCTTSKVGLQIHLNIIPIPSQKMLIKCEGNGARAEVMLGGQWTTLQFVYVKTQEGYFLPTVLFAEAFGTTTQGAVHRQMIKK